MVLELIGAGFTYRGSTRPALTSIDLRLEPGQMHAILGPVGAGASTLVRLITGLLGERGTSVGQVRLEGTAVMLGDDPEAQLSGMTSLVGDEVQLSGRLHGDEVTRVENRARETLDSLGIGDLWGRRVKYNGLTYLLHEVERQVAAVARCKTRADRGHPFGDGVDLCSQRYPSP